MVMTYEAGYTRVPESLKTDIKKFVYHLYDNRGNSELFLSQISGKYSRLTMII